LALQSCYSPKTDIEKDRHPEIPEFPKFSDPDIYAEKVLDLPVSQSSNCYYRQKGDYLFVYNYPGLDYASNETCRIFIIKNGKPVIFEKWKSRPRINNFAFTDEKGDLYVNNRKYLAPDYTRKKVFPVYNLDRVRDQYDHLLHLGEQEKDSAVLQKIAVEQKQLQERILGRIKEIRYIEDEGDSTVARSLSITASYLCNPGSENPFYIMPHFLEETLDAFEMRDVNYKDSLYGKYRPKMVPVPEQYKFTKTIRKQDTDSTSFEVKDKIVTGNQWFGTGNHFVTAFGYYPVYMYYYDVQSRNKTVKTKEDNTKMVILSIAKASTGKYFLVKNLKEGKFQIYFLKN
jgi:hypothetical protein